MCHSELFCGQLSTVPCESTLGSAEAELTSLEVFSLTFQKLIENTFWGFRTLECLYTRIKERSYYIGSHLGKCWIIEKWNESVHRRSCRFGRWHGRLRISEFSHWGSEAENGSYSALIVYWGWIEKGGSHVWGWLSWLQGTPVGRAHPQVTAQWCPFGGLKTSVMGISTPRKLASTTQDNSLGGAGVKYSLAHCSYFLVRLWAESQEPNSYSKSYPDVVVQSLSRVWLFATPWTAARQASLSLTISRNLLKFMSIESVMPYNYLILCHPLLLSVFLSIRVFSSESALNCIRWPKYWSFSFSISPSNEHPGLIDLL